MTTTLPYQAKTLPNNPNLIGIPVKDYVVIVHKDDFADFLVAKRAAEELQKSGRSISSVGVFPNNNSFVMVRQDPNGGRIYVMFFRSLVLPKDVNLNSINTYVFNLAHDSVALHEVRGDKLSTKKDLLRSKAATAISSLKKLAVYS